MNDSTRCIAIIGAGFCGTATAVNLLRKAHGAPLRVVLIDRDEHGRGTAYADHPYPYLLNVPASRMSAFSADPLHFFHYARRILPAVTPEDFLPRAVYGDYLQDTLRAAERDAGRGVVLERVRGTVCSLERQDAGSFTIAFTEGTTLEATEVVLALGNPGAARLQGAQALKESSRLVENPWSHHRAARAGESVLVIGTGLTMADVVVSATQGGARPARVHAISRHGLVPPRQTGFRHGHADFDPRPLLHASSFSMRLLFRQVRQICRDAEQRGADWREAITFVRSLAPKLWSRLPIRERRRFLRHVRAYWDHHRHRLPPSTRSALDELQESGHLSVRAGRILKLVPEGDQVRVTWQPRGAASAANFLVDRVINCTGPDYRCHTSGDPLIQDLLTGGLVKPDALGTGIRTSAKGGVIDAQGRGTPGLYYVGPMLRADHWEATAVGELRDHAARVADDLEPLADGRAVILRAHYSAYAPHT